VLLPFKFNDTDFDPMSNHGAKKNDYPYNLYRYVDDTDPERKEKISSNSTFFKGTPILFVHGNSGSHKQGRSLGVTPIEFVNRGERYHSTHAIYFDYFVGSFYRENVERKDLPNFDVFLVEFNEQLSALSGDLLVKQSKYVRAVMKYITSLYSEEFKPSEIIGVGHSMGGIVLKAASALTTKDVLPIKTIVTLSTPFKRHPVLLDRDSEVFYNQLVRLPHPKVDIFSIGGGWHDELIRSDLTGNPLREKKNPNFFHVISTTSAANTYCSTDHQVITWCKQVTISITKFIIDYAMQGGIALSKEQKKEIFEKHFINTNSKLQFYNKPPKNYTVKIMKESWNTVDKSSFSINKPSLLNVAKLLEKDEMLSILTTSRRSELNIILISKTEEAKVLLQENLDILPYFNVQGANNDIDERSITPKTIKTRIVFTKSQLKDYEFIGIENSAFKKYSVITHSLKDQIVEEATDLWSLLYEHKNRKVVSVGTTKGFNSVRFSKLPTQFSYSFKITERCTKSDINTLVHIRSNNAKESRLEQFSNSHSIQLKFFESKKESSGFNVDIYSGECEKMELEIGVDYRTTIVMIVKYHFSTTLVSNLFAMILFGVACMAWNSFEISFATALNRVLFTRGILIIGIELAFIYFNMDKSDFASFAYHESEPLYIVFSLLLAFTVLQLFYIIVQVLLLVLRIPGKLLNIVFGSKWVIIALSAALSVLISRYAHVGIAFVTIFLLMLLNIAGSNSQDTTYQSSMKMAYLMIHVIPTLIFVPSMIVWIKEWNEVIQTSKATLHGLDLFIQTLPSARFANMINPITLLPFLMTFAVIFTKSMPSEDHDAHRLIIAVLELAAIYSTAYYRFSVFGYALTASGLCSVLVMILTLIKRARKEKEE